LTFNAMVLSTISILRLEILFHAQKLNSKFSKVGCFFGKIMKNENKTKNTNNVNNKVFMTAEGLAKAKKELSELQTAKRKEIAQRIQSARELGDITENSEYEAALEEQAYIEGKIDELSEVIRQAEVVENPTSKDHCVNVGSRVRLHLEGAEMEYEIVGELEADPVQNKISHESPLGQALLGKKIGDKIEVEAPVGRLFYTVLNIH